MGFGKCFQDQIQTVGYILGKAKDIIPRLKGSKIDMYRTLREAGYDSQRAWKAVQEDEDLPEPPEQDEALPTNKSRAFTAEQQSKRKVGKQHIIQQIQNWGRTGKIYDKDTDEQVDVGSVDDLKMHFINKSDLSPYLDLTDKNIQTAFIAAMKKRAGVDPVVEAKKQGKSIGDWFAGLFGGKKSPEEKISEEAEQSSEFATMEDAQAAGDAGKIKNGQIVVINGKRYRWEN